MKMYEVMAKMGKGVTPPNSTCTTFPLLTSRIWENSGRAAEQVFIALHEGEVFEILPHTKEVEPTSDELAEHITEGSK